MVDIKNPLGGPNLQLLGCILYLVFFSVKKKVFCYIYHTFMGVGWGSLDMVKDRSVRKETRCHHYVSYSFQLAAWILHGVDPLSYFSFQPVLHDWCNKGHGMCYPVCGMVHIKDPLLLIDKSSLCGGSEFPFSLSEWSLTICLTPYNRR